MPLRCEDYLVDLSRRGLDEEMMELASRMQWEEGPKWAEATSASIQLAHKVNSAAVVSEYRWHRPPK